MKHLSLLTLTILLSLSVTSCKDDPDIPNPGNKEEEGLPIESIQIKSRVDLSDRQDWILQVDYTEYKYTNNGEQLEATAPEKPSYFNKSYPEGSKVALGEGPLIKLYSPSYRGAKTKFAGPVFPDMDDQSTLEKLLVADVLSSYYTGTVSSHLSGVQLTHANALLEFDLIDFPEEASVRVESLMRIIPYKEGNAYKVIIPVEEREYNATVLIAYNGNIESISIFSPIANQTEVPPLHNDRYITRDTHYQFSLRYNGEGKDISIENFRQSGWSGEDYPLTLELIKKEITEFRVFIGSLEGGIEISTEGLEPVKFWKGRFDYYPEAISFIDEETAILTPNVLPGSESDTFTYIFKSDSLFRYNSHTEKWFLSGDGDKYNFRYHMGYYTYSYRDPETNWYKSRLAHSNGFANETGLIDSPYPILQDMRLESDTLAFCNMIYIYANKKRSY